MAGIVAHIYCALALISSGALKIDDERSFIVGVTYPGISYLNVQTNESSYTLNPTWQHVVDAPNDFERGIRLHALLEKVRIDHLEKPLEPRLPSLLIMKHEILSFYEDSLLYTRINRWPSLMRYFDIILPQERAYAGHSDMIIHSWHTFVRTYCGQKPSAISSHLILNEMPTTRSRIPHGIPSLASKAYLAFAFNSLEKGSIVQSIMRFYEDSPRLLMGR